VEKTKDAVEKDSDAGTGIKLYNLQGKEDVATNISMYFLLILIYIIVVVIVCIHSV
jgi:hypothetical protein